MFAWLSSGRGRGGALAAAVVLMFALVACGGGGGGGGDTGGGGDGGGGGGGGGTGGTRDISGKVVDASTLTALPGVTVSSSGKTTISLQDGSFLLQGLPTTALIVTFQLTGYDNSTAQVNDATTTVVNVQMAHSGGSLGNVTQPPPPPDFDALQ